MCYMYIYIYIVGFNSLVCFAGIGLLTWGQGLLVLFIVKGFCFNKNCLAVMICIMHGSD